jgi:hypothetical protein
MLLQAPRSTQKTSNSSLPAASLHTAGAANHHGVCESKVEANLVKSGRSLMQSKITSLYGNGNQKVVEPARTHTGSFRHCLQLVIVLDFMFVTGIWSTLLHAGRNC